MTCALGCTASCGGTLLDGRSISASTSDHAHVAYKETGPSSAEVRFDDSPITIAGSAITTKNHVYQIAEKASKIEIRKADNKCYIYVDGVLAAVDTEQPRR